MIKKSSSRLKYFSQHEDVTLTAFQRDVYKWVQQIPRGKVMTYAQIAHALGMPQAMRAVGNALNKNIFFDVPCHRVVRSSGNVGGYAWGTDKKIAVLRKEGVRVNGEYIDLKLYGARKHS